MSVADEKILSRLQAAKVCKISVRFLDALRSRGLVRSFKVGGRRLYDIDMLREDLRRYFLEGEPV